MFVLFASNLRKLSRKLIPMTFVIMICCLFSVTAMAAGTKDAPEELELNVVHDDIISYDDQHWYKFTVPEQSVDPGYFEVSISNPEGIDLSNIELKDEASRTVYKIYSSENDVTPPKFGFAGQTMSLKIEGGYNAGNTPYKVEVKYTSDAYFEAEYNDSFDTANPVEFGHKYSGLILNSTEDYDWYSFTVPDQSLKPGRFRIKFGNKGEKDFNYSLKDKDNKTVYNASFNTAVDESPYFAFNGQTMYLQVSGGYNADETIYSVEIQYEEGSHYEAEYNDSTETVNSLEVGEKKEASIYNEETADFFKVNISDADDYHVRFYHNNGDLSYGGWKITLLNGDSGTLTELEVRESGEALSKTVSLSAGIYYIKVEENGNFDNIKNRPYMVSIEKGEGNGREEGKEGGDEIDGATEINYSEPKTANVGEYSISYNGAICFFGKARKFNSEADIYKVFGNVYINWNGKAYKVTSLKVSTKGGRHYMQILKTENSDRNFNKGLKKLTKGTSGLEFSLKPFKITKESGKNVLNIKMKNGKPKKVMVTTNGPKVYKAKKDKDYSINGNEITFKGENLEGSYTIS